MVNNHFYLPKLSLIVLTLMQKLWEFLLFLPGHLFPRSAVANQWSLEHWWFMRSERLGTVPLDDAISSPGFQKYVVRNENVVNRIQIWCQFQLPGVQMGGAGSLINVCLAR